MGRCGTEYSLKDQKGHGREGRIIIALHKQVRKPDEAPKIGAEHEAEAQDPENGGADAKIHKVFHQDVTGIFRPCKTRFTK